ncbi:MAG: antibiotic biosynthesis monooxygenase [Bacteroidota bacterium]
MIARIWHGKVPSAKAQDYHTCLLATGLPGYANVKGNRGVSLLKKEEGDITHYYTLTYWDDIDAIKRFAGEDYEKARYYPEDKYYLLEFEPLVTHYEVLEHFCNPNNSKEMQL